jgi:creatinine amidohydrolase
MQPTSRHWADLSTREFAALREAGTLARTVAVLPVAATEQHGPHLPLSVDTLICEGIVEAALPLLAADLPVLVLPTQTIGLSPEHAAFPGTLTLSPATLLAVWREIGGCVAAAGVQRLVLFNSHGGNVAPMDIAARMLRADCGLMVWQCSWFNLPLGDAGAAFSADEHRFGIHAGQIETALVRALAPQRVAMQHADDFASASQARAQQGLLLADGRSAKLGWQMQDYHPAGAVGHAAAATAEQGDALLAAAAAGLARLLAEVAALPGSTLQQGPQA